MKKKRQVKLRKYRLTPGTKIGQLEIIKRLRDKVTVTANLKVQYRVRCVCGNELTVPRYYLIRDNPKTHCGCQAKTIRTIYNQEYRCWLMAHYRTENPKHESYTHYRDRGIKVHPDFHKSRGIDGFAAFLNEIGPRPSKLFSVDRIDNTRGYEPGNVRWATAEEQRANQGNRIAGVDIVDIVSDDENEKVTELELELDETASAVDTEGEIEEDESE